MRDERDMWRNEYNKLKCVFLVFSAHICEYMCLFSQSECYTDATGYVSRLSYGVGVEIMAESVDDLSPWMASTIDTKPALSSHRAATMDIKPALPSLRTTPAAPYNPSDMPNASAPLPPNTLFTNIPLPQLKQEDHTHVKWWFETTYTTRRKAGKNSDDEGDFEGKIPSLSSRYLENGFGGQVPDSEKKAVQKKAKEFFHLILEMGRAPPVWGDLSLDIANEYLHFMESNFPFLRLCDNHWKARRVATNSYSQWYGKVSKRMAAAKAKVAPGGEVIDVDADDDAGKSSKRPRAEDDNTRHPKHPRTEETEPMPTPRPDSAKVTRQRQRVFDPLYVDYMRH